MDITLERYKEKLLDLGNGNKLLNFKTTKTENLEIIHPDCNEVFKRINQGESLDILDSDYYFKERYNYLSNAELSGLNISRREYFDYLLNKANEKNIIGYKANLFVNNTLKNIYDKYKLAIQEKGINTFYLASYFLNYKDKETSLMVKAPLLLIPLNIVKDEKKKTYSILSKDEEVIVNPTLRYKLMDSFKIELPSEFSDLDSFLDEVNEKIKEENWIISQESFLGHFTFMKMAMYEDLKENENRVLKNPLIKQIFGRKVDRVDEVVDSNDYLNEKDAFINLHNVCDADASQERAILAAKNGKSIILQGPPGTGKSQTITNLISEFLYEGKKVLFISEKIAALNIVYNNLAKVGLNDYCLELHSHKANKKEVIEEFNRVLNLEKEEYDQDYSYKLKELERNKERLNKYDEVIHTKIDYLGLSPYELYSIQTKYSKYNDLKDFYIKDIENKDLKYLDEVNNKLKTFANYTTIIGKDYHNFEWYGYINKDSTFEANRTFKRSLENVVKIIKERISFANIAKKHDIILNSYEDIDNFLEFSKLIQELPFFSPSLFSYDFYNLYSKVNELNKLLSKIEKLKEELKLVFVDDIYNTDLSLMLRRFEKSNKISRVVSKSYRQDLAFLKTYLCDKESKVEHEELVDKLRKVVEIQSKIKEYKEEEKTLKEKVEIISINEPANKEMLDYLTRFNTLLKKVQINSEIYNKDKFFEFRNTLIYLDRQYLEKCKTDLCNIEEFNQNFDLDIFDVKKENLKVSLNKLNKCLKNPNLNAWIEVLNILDFFNDYQVIDFVNEYLENNYDINEIDKVYTKIYYSQLIKYVIDSIPTLKDFKRVEHDSYVEAFKELDHLKFEITKQEIKNNLNKMIPSASNVLNNSPVSIILKESNKKKQQMPLRLFFEKVNEVTQVLKPVFLMSPLSVSTYLPSDLTFDVVIFDEASQIFPQDALVAIYRAKQLIVVGDSKQMPPSNFFMASITDSDEYKEDDDVNAYESILDTSLAASFPQFSLAWHYRSRIEELITFSNYKFYHHNLVTFKSTNHLDNDNGVSFILCNNGYYERVSGINRNEAELVADLVFRHFATNPNRSLGVVAFSQSQQNQINKVIQRRRDLKPEFDEFFSDNKKEPFFIKNLETVQGDERDTIIFSIGYGRDANGRFLMNFGPLGQKGGERRLNVAITRAKFNIKIVSSIRYVDIDETKITNDGPKLLKLYLEYAEKGSQILGINEEVKKLDQANEFEKEVYEFLKENSFVVDKYVGSSSQKIDVALKSPLTNDYVLAIECDGSTYHKSKSSRDRDRLREEILTKIGWKYYRVWSTEWFKNKDVEKRKLLEVCNSALNEVNEKYLNKEKNLNIEEYKTLFTNYPSYDFDKLNEEYKTNHNLFKVIYSIIENEGPIHLDVILKRLTKFLNTQKVTSRVLKEFESELEYNPDVILFEMDGYYSLSNNFSPKFRIKGEESTNREIKYIPKEELKDAILTLIKYKGGMSKDLLYQVITKLIDVNLNSSAIMVLDEVFNSLIESNLIELDKENNTYKLA